MDGNLGEKRPRRRWTKRAAWALWATFATLASPSLADEATLDRARALLQEERLEEAARVYAAVLDAAPENRDARLEHARTLGWQDRYEEAVRELDVLLADHPDDVEARAERARILGWMKRFDEADREIERALETAPGYVDGHLVRGDLQAWQERREEASAAYRDAQALAPDDPRPWLRLARVQAWQGRRSEAMASYEEALRLQPDSREAREALRRIANEPGFHRFRIDLGVRFDAVDSGRSDWWQEWLMLGYRPTEQIAVYTGVEQYRRFGNDDTQWVIGGAWALPQRWWIDARVAVGIDTDVVAQQMFELELTHGFSERWVGRLRYQRAHFSGDVETDAISPGVEFLPVPELRLLGRYYLTHVNGGRLGHAGSLRGDLFPDAALSPYVGVAAGTQVFAPASVGEDRKRARIVSVTTGTIWRITDHVGLRLDLEYEDLEDTYARWGVSTGLFASF